MVMIAYASCAIGLVALAMSFLPSATPAWHTPVSPRLRTFEEPRVARPTVCQPSEQIADWVAPEDLRRLRESFESPSSRPVQDGLNPGQMKLVEMASVGPTESVAGARLLRTYLMVEAMSELADCQASSASCPIPSTIIHLETRARQLSREAPERSGWAELHDQWRAFLQSDLNRFQSCLQT